MEEKTIGTKVRIVIEEGEKNTMSEKDYTIIRIVNYKDANDWCDHYIVRSEDGDEQDIKEWNCVYPPVESEYDDYRADKFLSDNGIWAEVYPYGHDLPVMAVHINWGDWKHEHGCSEYLMGLLGYSQIGCNVTEEDGSDCYSATHFFIKTR